MAPIVASNRPLPTFSAPRGGHLNARMLETFEGDGVLVLSDFVSLKACRKLQQRALQLVEEFDVEASKSVFSTTRQEQLSDRYFLESGGTIRCFFESEAFDNAGNLRQARERSINKMGHAMHDLDPVFDAFSRTQELAEVARSIRFASPLILQSMYIFKPPHIGGEVVCHQDSTYLYTEPESCVGFWFALEDATLENGCMQFIPGAQRSPLRKRNYRNAEGRLVTETMDDTPWPMERLVPAEVEAGTLVVFHGRTPHLSAANRSEKSRHAYTLHVIERDSHYPADNWLQRSDALPLRGF